MSSQSGMYMSHTNARPRGDYQKPVMSQLATQMGGSEVVRPDTWDEVLSHLQSVLEENAKLNETLENNNNQMEKIMEKKNNEVEIAQKLYWDVRISVLGFKAHIMKLSGELDQLREGQRNDSSLEMKKLQEEMEQLKLSKDNAERRTTNMNGDINEMKEQVQSWRKRYESVVQEKNNQKAKTEQLEKELEEKSKLPIPKPRTNIQKPDQNRMAQLEKENRELSQKAEADRRDRETVERKWAQLQRVFSEKEEEFQRELNLTKIKITSLERDKLDLQHQLTQPKHSVMDTLATEKEAGGRLAQRRQLNQLMSEHQRLEEQNRKQNEYLQDKVQELNECRQSYDNLVKETQRLKENNRDMSQRLESVEETNTDKIYSLEQSVATLREEIARLTEQLQNEREKYHQLTVNYAQAESALRHHKQNFDTENTEWSDYVAEMEKQLTVIQEKMSAKDSTLQQVQREKQQMVTEKEMAEQEILRYKEKLDKKQKNCDELLDQMHLWREQYESAQSDFTHERNVREKEAVAVQTLRQNRDALQREVGELRKRVTDQQMQIADLEHTFNVTSDSYTKVHTVVGGIPDWSPNTQHIPYQRSGMEDIRARNVSGEQHMRRDEEMFTTGHHHSPLNNRRVLDPPGRDLNIHHNFGQPQEPIIPKKQEPDHQRLLHQPIHQFQDEPKHRFQDEPMNQLNIEPVKPVNPFPNNPRGPNIFAQFPPVDPLPLPRQHMPPPPPLQGGMGGVIGGIQPLPGEIENFAMPTMSCPICQRKDFKTQTELEVHCAKCD